MRRIENRIPYQGGVGLVNGARPSSRSRNFRARIIKRGREAGERVQQMLLVFMIFIKEVTNQILLPGNRALADSAFSSEWRCVHANSLCFVSGR